MLSNLIFTEKFLTQVAGKKKHVKLGFYIQLSRGLGKYFASHFHNLGLVQEKKMTSFKYDFKCFMSFSFFFHLFLDLRQSSTLRFSVSISRFINKLSLFFTCQNFLLFLFTSALCCNSDMTHACGTITARSLRDHCVPSLRDHCAITAQSLR